VNERKEGRNQLRQGLITAWVSVPGGLLRFVRGTHKHTTGAGAVQLAADTRREEGIDGLLHSSVVRDM